MARNKNGQIIPDDQNVNYGTNTAKVQKESTANLKAGNDKEKLDELYSRYDSVTNSRAQDEIAKQIYKLETGTAYSGTGGKSIPLQRFNKGYDSAIGVRGSEVYTKSEDPNKKPLPAGSSSGTDTTPLPKVEQEQIDVSNDATRQEKAQLKQTADEVREDTRKNNLIDIAEEGRKKYDLFSSNVDSHYIDGLPRSIWNAWKNGKFGTPDSKDAKSVRNTLLMNEIGTMLSNMGSAIGRNGEMKEGLWSSSVRRNMEEADKRNNDKFETNMKNQLAQLDLSAKEQLEMEKHINELMADNTFAVAAKHANNIEDTIGLWHLKQALGKEWNNMSSKDKMGFLNAVNAIQNGDTTSGKAMLQSVLGDEGMAKLQKQMSDYQMKQSKANADMAETDANFRGVQNTMGVVNNVAGAIGSVVGLAK